MGGFGKISIPTQRQRFPQKFNQFNSAIFEILSFTLYSRYDTNSKILFFHRFFSFVIKEVLLKVKEMAMRVKILENVMDYMENHLADCGAAIQV